MFETYRSTPVDRDGRPLTVEEPLRVPLPVPGMSRRTLCPRLASRSSCGRIRVKPCLDAPAADTIAEQPGPRLPGPPYPALGKRQRDLPRYTGKAEKKRALPAAGFGTETEQGLCRPGTQTGIGAGIFLSYPHYTGTLSTFAMDAGGNAQIFSVA